MTSRPTYDQGAIDNPLGDHHDQLLEIEATIQASKESLEKLLALYRSLLDSCTYFESTSQTYLEQQYQKYQSLFLHEVEMINRTSNQLFVQSGNHASSLGSLNEAINRCNKSLGTFEQLALRVLSLFRSNHRLGQRIREFVLMETIPMVPFVPPSCIADANTHRLLVESFYQSPRILYPDTGDPPVTGDDAKKPTMASHVQFSDEVSSLQSTIGTHPSNTIADNTFGRLPLHLVDAILSYLDLHTILTLTQVCATWRDAIYHSQIFPFLSISWSKVFPHLRYMHSVPMAIQQLPPPPFEAFPMSTYHLIDTLYTEEWQRLEPDLLMALLFRQSAYYFKLFPERTPLLLANIPTPYQALAHLAPSSFLSLTTAEDSSHAPASQRGPTNRKSDVLNGSSSTPSPHVPSLLRFNPPFTDSFLQSQRQENTPTHAHYTVELVQSEPSKTYQISVKSVDVTVEECQNNAHLNSACSLQHTPIISQCRSIIDHHLHITQARLDHTNLLHKLDDANDTKKMTSQSIQQWKSDITATQSSASNMSKQLDSDTITISFLQRQLAQLQAKHEYISQSREKQPSTRNQPQDSQRQSTIRVQQTSIGDHQQEQTPPTTTDIPVITISNPQLHTITAGGKPMMMTEQSGDAYSDTIQMEEYDVDLDVDIPDFEFHFPDSTFSN